MGTSLASERLSTLQHEIHDLDRRVLGRCRRPPPGQPSHPHRQAIAEPRHGETSVLVQLRDGERNSSARAESRSRSEPNPKSLEPCRRAATLSLKIARDTPSPGWPMRTDSRPREIICPLLPLCPSTSSRCSTT